MNFIDLARLELARRKGIRDAILDGFEITESNQDRVKRSEVVGWVLRSLRAEPAENNWWYTQVIKEVVALGGQLIKPQNKKMFRRVRRRATGPSVPRV